MMEGVTFSAVLLNQNRGSPDGQIGVLKATKPMVATHGRLLAPETAHVQGEVLMSLSSL